MDKLCTACKQSFPATGEYFHNNKGTKDGLTNVCKPCAKARATKWRADNREHHRKTSKEWRLANPEKANALTRKWIKEHPEQRKETRTKSKIKHRDSINEKSRIFYWENKELMARRKREYCLTHKEQLRTQSSRRRALQRNAPGKFTGDDIKAKWLEQDGKCCYCDGKLGDKYTIEHLQPLSKGGSNWPENIALACDYCNKSRGNKTLEEWIKVRGW